MKCQFKKTVVNHFFHVVALFASIVLVGCNNIIDLPRESYNPETQQREYHYYRPYYQLETAFLNSQLNLTLISKLNNATLPGIYSLKQAMNRVSPNDYMKDAEFTLYLRNMSKQDVTIDLRAVHINYKRLPLSQRIITIPPEVSVSWQLGHSLVDFRTTELKTQITWFDTHLYEQEFYMKRVIKEVVEEPEYREESDIIKHHTDEL